MAIQNYFLERNYTRHSISDLLYEEEWAPHFFKDPVENGLDQLLQLALEPLPNY